jgi:predicted thioesterase
MDTIIPGLIGEHTLTVTDPLTAQAMGSGSLPVFATPALIALMEAAAVAALEGRLPEGQTTVGARIEVSHLAATPLGQTVRARAEVRAVDGRQIHFHIEAWDERQRIGQAAHTRVIVEIERFLKRLNTPPPTQP